MEPTDIGVIGIIGIIRASGMPKEIPRKALRHSSGLVQERLF